MFDTLAYARRVHAAGVPQEQAEAMAAALDAALRSRTNDWSPAAIPTSGWPI
jgi:hypothetical protein